MRNKSFFNGKIEEVFLRAVYIISTVFLALIVFNLFQYFDPQAVIVGVFGILFGMAFIVLSNFAFLFVIDLLTYILLKRRNTMESEIEHCSPSDKDKK